MLNLNQSIDSSNAVDPAHLTMHSLIGVGTLMRCVRVVSNLGRSLTPIDVGILAAVFVFEHTRAEFVYRVIKLYKK